MAPGDIADGYPCASMDGFTAADHHSWQLYNIFSDVGWFHLWALRDFYLCWSDLLDDNTAGLFPTWHRVEPDGFLRVGEGQCESNPQNTTHNRAVRHGSLPAQQRTGFALDDRR